MTNLLIKFLTPVLKPLQNQVITRAKEIATVAVGAWVAAFFGNDVVQGLLTHVQLPEGTTPEGLATAISMAAGALIGGVLSDLFSSFNRGGTVELQKLLKDRYGIDVKVDGWFGPKTQEAVEKVKAATEKL